MINFKSDITKSILGEGITNRKMVSRKEAKYYLSVIAHNADKGNWIRMVVIKFLGGNSNWEIDSVVKRLKEIEHDIKQMQIRLEETSK